MSIVAFFGNQREGARKDIIARKDGHLIIPASIGRSRAAACIRLIDDIVMNQRCRMDEFKGLGQRQDMSEVKRPAPMCRQQAERWTDALAAGCDNMQSDFCHELIGGSHRFLQPLFQNFEVAFYYIKHLV